jgi:hypothetical protein
MHKRYNSNSISWGRRDSMPSFQPKVVILQDGQLILGKYGEYYISYEAALDEEIQILKEKQMEYQGNEYEFIGKIIIE